MPGALPPLIGWTASRGTISIGGLALFAIVFLWQIPHFMAIAWMYRDDYRKAGFPMLQVVEPDGRRTGRHAALFALALVPMTLVPTIVGIAGSLYGGLAVVLTAGGMAAVSKISSLLLAAIAVMMIRRGITEILRAAG